MITSHGKGCVSEETDLFLGSFGIACPPENEQKLRDYQPDLVVTLGTRLGEVATLNWSDALSKNTTLIQILDAAKDFNSAFPTAKKIVMRIEDLFESLWKLSGVKSRETVEPPTAGFQVDTSEWLDQETPVHPIKLVRCVERVLPVDGLLVSDIGNSMAWLMCHFKVARKKEFYVPLSLGSMGSGIGTAIGAKLARPDRAVLCVTGDCAALMYGSELVTAREQNLGVIFIILNDAGHGMVDHGHRLIGLPEVNLRFKKFVDYKMWAESLGVEGHRVDSTEQFMNLPWQEWVNGKSPVVLDVRIDATVVPPIKSRARVLGQGDQVTVKQ